MNARLAAFELLTQWDKGKTFADELLANARLTSDTDSQTNALTTELFYGVLRQRALLDWLIEKCAQRPPRRSVANLLRLGAYQLFFLDGIPAYAAVSETTNLAKKICSLKEAQFVHALLRKLAANLQEIHAAMDTLEKNEPQIFYSHPAWLFNQWTAQWERADARSLCRWNNEPPSLTLRVNRLKTDAATFAQQLQKNRIVFESHPVRDNCFVIRGVAAEKMPGFSDGWFYIQDPSTLLSVDALDAKPGDTVLDACAAPGGKTLAIAEKMLNRGRILACDVSPKRLAFVRENAQRLGSTIVETAAFDFAVKQSPKVLKDFCRKLGFESFDRILVDVPCSNTGVMRRRVDVRWRLKSEDLPRLAATQKQILATAAAMLKPDGILVYSTCSLEREENEGVVGWFLSEQPQFRLKNQRATFPPRDKMDGAFVAAIRQG